MLKTTIIELRFQLAFTGKHLIRGRESHYRRKQSSLEFKRFFKKTNKYQFKGIIPNNYNHVILMSAKNHKEYQKNFIFFAKY